MDPDSEQKYYSRKAPSFYGIGHDSMRLMNKDGLI